MRHATIFTLRAEPQVIFIKEAGKNVVHMNCIRCHQNIISGPEMIVKNKNFKCTIDDRKCWDCYRETPHGTVNSLSSVSYARVPLPESPVPGWLKELSKNKE
jgi:cytochrome c nitrite reductase small subunit